MSALLDENEKILFSVIFPTYGVEDYIGDAISDILGQTYRNFELLIVDDASRDHSGAIAGEFASRDTRVRVLTKEENEGLSAARNTGLAAAAGDYCLFLDPDDRFEKDLLDRIHEAVLLRKQPDVILYGLTEDYFNRDGKKAYSVSHRPPEGAFETPGDLHRILMPLEAETLYGYAWNKAYRTAFLKEGGFSFPKIPHIEDVLFNADVFDRARSLVTLDFCPVHYRNMLFEKRTSRLTGGPIADYFSLQKKRISRLLAQQRSFGTLDTRALQILSAEYFRSFSSALVRKTDGGKKKKDLLREAGEETETELFRELSPAFVPSGRAMKFLLQPLAAGQVKRGVRRARLASFAKRHFPILFARLKQER